MQIIQKTFGEIRFRCSSPCVDFSAFVLCFAWIVAYNKNCHTSESEFLDFDITSFLYMARGGQPLLYK